MRSILILVLLIFVVVIMGCSKNTLNTFTSEQINNPDSIELPIDTSDEAISYSLSLSQVQDRLNTPLDENMDKYNQYDWWSRAHQSEMLQEGQIVWIVDWFKGPGECQSPFGCQILIGSDGTILRDIQCSDGYNCK